ncbi:MAG: hypothetical protein OES47_15485 [Acidobacteriota bacterium]|nr:hypothetical protein [Acidobacteriota bacterium]
MSDRETKAPEPAAARRASPWRFLGVAGALVLGVVFLIAAWAKAIDPVAFAEQITAEGLDFLLPASLVGWGAIVLEVVLGLALVLGLRRKAVLWPTGVLIVLFLSLTGRAYWRFLNGIEETSSCGCFGNLWNRTPAEAFWQDILLLVPPFVLACVWRPVAAMQRKWKLAAVALAAVVSGFFVWRSPELPLDNLATRLSPGVRVADLCAGSTSDPGELACLDLLLPELLTGTHLVVIDAFGSETLQAEMGRLNELAQSGNLEGVWLLNDATEEERSTFLLLRAPVFGVREVPAPLLRPLYRHLPRVFAVEEGSVTTTWSHYPAPDAV